MTTEVSAELLLEQARATLRESFGYPGFRPGQERAITSVAQRPRHARRAAHRRRQVALLPGAGADAAGPHRRRVAAHLADEGPGRRARPRAACRRRSSTARSPARRFRIASRALARGDIKLLYVAPERFDAGTTAERLRAMGVSLLAVDEAHCISEWGHDFRPSYLRMRNVRERLGAPPTVALTATATPEVRRDIATQLALRNPIDHRHGLRPHESALSRPSHAQRRREGRRARADPARARRARGRLRVDAPQRRADRRRAGARARSRPPRITPASTTRTGTRCRTAS